jgi:tetratricopeptide (TPR) repeat protein
MRLSAISLAALAIILVSLLSAGQEAATSASELRLGVESYKNSRYEEAAGHFQKAVELDGWNLNARLYLATAYMQQYIPGVETPENTQIAEKAIEQYLHVLDSDAEKTPRVNSAKGIAYLYLNMKKFEDSKRYYEIAAGLDPDDPESYYSVGVIDWTQSYEPRMVARAKLEVPPEENLNAKDPEQKKVCDDLRARNMPTVEEGIQNLNKAIQIRPDYDDAMAYLNLMYRERADLECDNPAARTEDLTTADHWVDETLRVKKLKAEKSKVLEKPTAPNPQ